MKTRVLISFPSIGRRHILSILSYFSGSHHARTAQLFVEMQCTSGSKMRPFIKFLVYKIIYQTMSKKWINQTETFQLQAQPPELHTAQHYLKLKKKSIWYAAERMHWQNAKLFLSLFFSGLLNFLCVLAYFSAKLYSGRRLLMVDHKRVFLAVASTNKWKI